MFFQGKKIEVKTLDGLITRVNREGIPQSLNSRCADLNREVINRAEARYVLKPV